MPFQYDRFSDPTTGSIRDLILRQGDIRAQQAQTIGNAQARATEQSGQAWSGAIQTVGQAIAGIPQQIAQFKQQEQQSQLLKLKTDESTQNLKMGEADLAVKNRAQAANTTFARLMKETPKLTEDGVSVWDTAAITKAFADEGYGPEAASRAQHLDELNGSFLQAKAARQALVQTGAAKVAAAGNDPTFARLFLDQLRENGNFKPEQLDRFSAYLDEDPVTNTAKLTAFLMGPQKHERGAPGTFAIGPDNMPIPGSQVPDPIGEATAARANAAQLETARHNAALEAIGTSTGDRAGAAQRETARHNAAMERTGAGTEPLVAVIGPDNKPVLVPRAQAVGKTPASAGQGRAVTPSEADDLSAFDTGLDAVADVRKALADTPNATGIVAQATAAVPYLPSDAKNRLAVIDRVRQVIGKTLEGGVLRKEDEVKYEKILPTLADPPSVAAAKLNGLERAIIQQRQRRLDNLAAAGYDTSKFTTRQPGGGGGNTTTAPLRQPIPGHPGAFAVSMDGGKTWKAE